MIKNIIFDFGDIFINLDKKIIFKEIERFGGNSMPTPEMIQINHLFEVGAVSAHEFVSQMQSFYSKASSPEIIAIWNSMLLDFPEYRLTFLERLASEQEYRLFLLSNTNELHIPHVVKTMGANRFNRFKACFEQFYLSHEIHLRKPNKETFQFVLQTNGLKANETLFVDDTEENTKAAEKLGIQCWNLQVGVEDIVQLKEKL